MYLAGGFLDLCGLEEPADTVSLVELPIPVETTGVAVVSAGEGGNEGEGGSGNPSTLMPPPDGVLTIAVGVLAVGRHMPVEAICLSGVWLPDCSVVPVTETPLSLSASEVGELLTRERLKLLKRPAFFEETETATSSLFSSRLTMMWEREAEKGGGGDQPG